MPANLTPQYQEAEDAYKAAKTNEERLAALEDMLAYIPKHKGTEKMQADIKKRLSKLRAEIIDERGRKGGKVDPYRVQKEGAAQAFIVGPVNSGKSSIVGWLTNAKVVIAEYPFSTTIPVSGMMQYEDIKMQLVDTPPIVMEDPVSSLFSNARLCDVLIIVLDASDQSSVYILDGLTQLLRSRKTLVDSTDASGAGITKDRILIVANKMDLELASENLSTMMELLPDYKYLACSTLSGEGMPDIPAAVFELAGIVRVYAKPPGGKLERKDPFVVKRGASVEDVAGVIHRQLQHSFKNARLWGSSRYSGQSVPRDFLVSDGDIIEFS